MCVGLVYDDSVSGGNQIGIVYTVEGDLMGEYGVEMEVDWA